MGSVYWIVKNNPMDGYGRRRLGGVGRCEEKTIVGRIGRRPPLRSSGFRVLLVLFYSIQKLGAGSCTKLLVCGAPHTTHKKVVAAIRHRDRCVAQRVFVFVCDQNIKNYLTYFNLFQSCACINGPFLRT